MSEIFFDEMEIPKPKYNLNIQSLTHGAMTGRQIEEIEKILFKEKPDWLLVYGDTNSTLSGALAAAKMNIKIAHVESGLRSFNKNMPEEINRLLTDHLSDILFVPSSNAENNLISEGISKEKIQNVGDIMYETSIFFSKFANKKSKILKKLKLKKKSTFFLLSIDKRIPITKKDYMISLQDCHTQSCQFLFQFIQGP